MKLPIQPFDDALRRDILAASARPFDRAYKLHGADYDPDTCGEAADEVIALLVSKLLGVRVTLAPQAVVGNGTLVVEPSEET
jgi:hypothetical protein